MAWATEVVQPKQPHESFIDWVPREFNTWADKFAKDCLRMRASDFISFPCEADILCLRGAWDGARNQHGLASAAWWLQFATDVDDEGHPVWQQACSGCIFIGKATVIQAETLGCVKLVECVLQFARARCFTSNELLRVPSWILEVIEVLDD